MPTADHAVCLSLPSGSKTGPRGYTNDSLFNKVTATTVVVRWKYEMKVIFHTQAQPLSRICQQFEYYLS